MNIIKVEKYINFFFYRKALFVTPMIKKLSLANHMQFKKKLQENLIRLYIYA